MRLNNYRHDCSRFLKNYTKSCGDRAKTRRYCQIVDLTEELDQAIEKKNKKKAKALAAELVQLQKQVPEYVALSNILEHADLKSPDGREIAIIIQSLIQTCPE